MTPEQFKDSMAYLGIAYGKEFTQQELTIYYDFLREYSDATLVTAIKNIIRKSKFLPKITEILEECENCKEQSKNTVLAFMANQGYFKVPSEYDRAATWIERNIMPEWFKEDMKKYHAMMKQERLGYNETLMIKH